MMLHCLPLCAETPCGSQLVQVKDYRQIGSARQKAARLSVAEVIFNINVMVKYRCRQDGGINSVNKSVDLILN